jgi:hypothetical protein
VNDHVEEGKYCENRDSCGYECDLPSRLVYKPYEVDADLTAKLCTVKQIE